VLDGNSSSRIQALAVFQCTLASIELGGDTPGWYKGPVPNPTSSSGGMCSPSHQPGLIRFQNNAQPLARETDEDDVFHLEGAQLRVVVGTMSRGAIPFAEIVEIFCSLQPSQEHQQFIFPVTMSSIDSGSESEAASIADSSNIDSGSDLEFREEAPRKRRRISPVYEEPKQAVAKSSAPSLSRIKAKKPNVSVQKSKEIEDNISTKESENSVSVKLENAKFADINVHPWLVRSLANMAITRPTGIQKGCIPEILKGRDCIGGSRTGSGKTVAFAVPILQKWAEDPVGIFAVVLTPTRYV
jgi:hypothetical protein